MSKFVKLSSIAELTVGFVGTMAKHYEDEGIPFLRSLNIKPFKIISDDMKYVSAEFSNSLSKSILHKGDVVIVRTGIPGTCCVVPAEYDGCNCSDVVIVHPNTELVNPHYLAAYINFWGQRQIQNNKVGAIQQHFNVHSAEEMLIFLPDITEQEKIAKTIVALNGKIENNFSVCVELEAMAKTLYDYWFTQFDFPNEEGKPYKSSGGEMVWNEKLKREIPIDWEVLSLFDAVSVQYGFPFATEQFTEEETNVPVVRIRDILEGTTSAYSLEKADEKYHLNENDVLVGMDGNFHMNFWHDNIAYLNQRCVRLRAHSDSTISSIQILHSIKPYIKAKEQNAKGSTVGHLSDKDLKGLYLIKPLKTRAFNPRKTLDGLLALVIENKKQILSLTKQRDELLPLLINGQITIE